MKKELHPLDEAGITINELIPPNQFLRRLGTFYPMKFIALLSLLQDVSGGRQQDE